MHSDEEITPPTLYCEDETRLPILNGMEYKEALLNISDSNNKAALLYHEKAIESVHKAFRKEFENRKEIKSISDTPKVGGQAAVFKVEWVDGLTSALKVFIDSYDPDNLFESESGFTNYALELQQFKIPLYPKTTCTFHATGTLKVLVQKESYTYPYLLMEYVEHNFKQFCLELSQLKDLKSSSYIERILSKAVHRMNVLGILHRDLKAKNLRITKDGLPKIIDFGISKNLSINPYEFFWEKRQQLYEVYELLESLGLREPDTTGLVHRGEMYE